MVQLTILRKIGQLIGIGVIAGVLVAALALPAVGGMGITARNASLGFLELPTELETPPPPQRSVILDRDDEVIAEIYDQNRELVGLDEISPVMQQAMLAIEDERFYEHGGVDVQGTFRAALRTLSGNTEGGSTLTQQYVENVQVYSAATQEEAQAIRNASIPSKLRELRYALALEQRLTKDEILERYLNIVYFSDGAYGIESAAQHFFNTTAAELTLPQAALLAGLVRYPYQYDPTVYPENALIRRNEVLGRMLANGMITQEQHDEAAATELELDVVEHENGCYFSEAPYFCDYVVREIESNPQFGETPEERSEFLRRNGLVIHTTLDLDMQEAAQNAIEERVPVGDPSNKIAAEVLMEPGSGEIRAMAQSTEYGNEDERGVTAVNYSVDADQGGSTGFQPGSTFKAITLAAALDEGMGFGTDFNSPGSMSLSSGFQDCDGNNVTSPADPWNVANSSESNAGIHDMRSGTAGSVNTYFAQLESRVGLCDVVQMAERLGAHRADGNELNQVASFTLGSNEVSPLTMATVYSTFASRGIRCEPMAITEIRDRVNGETMEFESDCERAISQEVADGVNTLLQAGFRPGGTAYGSGLSRPAAGKTGTADRSQYAWFAGYTPNLTGIVAVGDPRGSQPEHRLENVEIGGQYYPAVYGGTIPAPIWQATMQVATEGLEAEGFPGAPGRFNTPSQLRQQQEQQQQENDEGGGEGGGGNGNGNGNGRGNDDD
ncbi:transglycosylase domain-containing protein [Allonocardiopsis opalescens]|uniref:Membrane peptidoglycan carboxypeptidase n=1 Tax=Allonocardiopsis opalescens TaxID=1144618 RepID=A0A2T0Q6P2_9ACTN|nr:transglycosylase domain-containing protein [Allonocardiopsis opalescens]PRX99497.1 membrane peptidoglycan carboxypeptidase [Allonocardiopsis opalescens]